MKFWHPVAAGIFAAASLLAQGAPAQYSSANTQWVGEILKKVLTIKPDMTRGDLLKVLTTEGGISTPLQRTYVARECLYIKVRVVFEAVGRPARDPDGRVSMRESEADRIVSISEPFVQFGVFD